MLPLLDLIILLCKMGIIIITNSKKLNFKKSKGLIDKLYRHKIHTFLV
jgi:hypothetical protein